MVAEEVKELATQTSDATSNIDTTLHTLEDQTQALIAQGAKARRAQPPSRPAPTRDKR